MATDRLQSLLNTLEIIDVDEFSSINLIADFSALIATYYQGFSLITNPYPDSEHVFNPELIL